MRRGVGDWSPKHLLRSVSSILLLNSSSLPSPCPHLPPYHCSFHLLLKHPDLEREHLRGWNSQLRASSKRTHFSQHCKMNMNNTSPLIFFYLFLLQTSYTQDIWFCNHYSCRRMFYLHAELLSDPIRQFQGKKCLFGGTKSRELGSQYLVQCLSWLADTATPGFGWETSKIGLGFFWESFTDSLFLQASKKSCWEK